MPPKPVKHAGAAMKSLRVAWWCVRVPFVLAHAMAAVIVRLSGAFILATRDEITCRGCGEPVSFVGRFECGWCGYVFDGFAFARCEVCGAVPPFLNCQACGASVKNPTLFP